MTALRRLGVKRGERVGVFMFNSCEFVTAWMGENHFAPAPTAVYGVILLLAMPTWFNQLGRSRGVRVLARAPSPASGLLPSLLVAGAVLVTALIYVVVNSCVDLSYGILDPRTRRVHA